MQHDFYSFTKILNYKDWSKSIAIIYLYSILKYFSNGGGGGEYCTKTRRRLCKCRSTVIESSLRLTIPLCPKIAWIFSLYIPWNIISNMYFLNFVECCHSYVSYKEGVWLFEKHYGWMCWWLSLHHCQKLSLHL